MSSHIPLLVLPAVLAGMIAFALAGYVFQRQSPVFDTRGMVFFLLTSGVSSFLLALVYVAQTVWVMVFLLNLLLTSLLFGLFGLLHFSLVFADRRDALTRRRMTLLAVCSVGFLLVLFTDGIHNTFRADVEVYTEPTRMVNSVYGPLGNVGLLYLFVLVLISWYLILNHIFRSETTHREQGLILVLAVAFPLTGAVLNLLNWPHPAFNNVPIFSVIAGLFFTIAISKYQFLDVVPLAYEEIVDNMDDYIIVTGPTGAVLALNDQAERIVDAPDPVGRPAEELLPMERPLSDGEGGGDDEQRWETQLTIDRAADRQVLDLRSTPIHARDGRFLGRAITLRDITDLKEREAKLRRQNERLDQFASMISHDLRNPLNVAQLRLEFVADESEDEHAQAVQESLSRMETMIDELLTLARAGQEIETTEQCHLNELVVQSWADVQTADVELNCLIEDETIQADSSRLRHVFENLFRNVVDHNDPPLLVCVGLLDDGRGFYVEDDGDGIPESEREEVFEHGFTTSETGTGFGLSIVEDIVDAHGWSIAVTESDEGGARFEISFDGETRRR
jgi:PAS domain S-box-containing protein